MARSESTPKKKRKKKADAASPSPAAASTRKKGRKKKAAGAKASAPERAAHRLRRDGPPVVGVVFGAPSELRAAAPLTSALSELDVPAEVRVLSPHWTPERVVEYGRGARERGLEAVVVCSSVAAPLGAMLAAHTTVPVVAAPVADGVLQGVDALLAVARAPVAAPFATVGLGAVREAAFFVARLLAAAHPELHDRLEAHRLAALERYDDAEIRMAAAARARNNLW